MNDNKNAGINKTVKPIRVQLPRKKGWRMPFNTVKVDRSTKWGNPFKKSEYYDVVEQFKLSLAWELQALIHYDPVDPLNKKMRWIAEHIHELKGKHLACWCPLNVPCHANVLLYYANR